MADKFDVATEAARIANLAALAARPENSMDFNDSPAYDAFMCETFAITPEERKAVLGYIDQHNNLTVTHDAGAPVLDLDDAVLKTPNGATSLFHLSDQWKEIYVPPDAACKKGIIS